MALLIAGVGMVGLAALGLDSRDVIVSMSAFAAGVLLYLGVRNILSWLEGEHPRGWAYGLLRLGTVLIVLLVAEAVGKAPSPPGVTWRVVAYQIGLALIVVGGLGVAFEHRPFKRRESGP